MASPATEAVGWRAPLFVNGAWVDGAEASPVFDKFTGEPIGVAARATREQVARRRRWAPAPPSSASPWTGSAATRFSTTPRR